eukprot:10083200-Lingulodinium_polyedra.AAC.1
MLLPVVACLRERARARAVVVGELGRRAQLLGRGKRAMCRYMQVDAAPIEAAPSTAGPTIA